MAKRTWTDEFVVLSISMFYRLGQIRTTITVKRPNRSEGQSN